MSKSGLFAHFGSKEELQLATIDAARRRFVEHVVKPSRALPRGRERVEPLMRDWLGYYRTRFSPAAASSTRSRPSSTAAPRAQCVRS